MTTIDLDLLRTFKPHPKQAQFILADQRFTLALTGIGFGKTWALTLKCLIAALSNRSALTLLAGRTYRDLNDVLVPLLLQHIASVQESTGVSLIAKWDKLDSRIDLLGGGSILLRSYMHIDKIRGLNLGAAFIDEIEWSSADPVEVFGVLNERVRVPCPAHSINIATSPNGLLGVTRIFYEAQLRDDHDYHITHGTTLDNPHLSPAFVRTLKASMSERRWAQEVEGRVLRPQHVCFAEFSDGHLVDWHWQDHARHKWVLGVDWGTNHHHVALMVQVLEDGTWVIADELLCDDMPRGAFRKRLRAWVEERATVCGYPTAAGTDRAVPEMNQWLMNVLGHRGTHVRNCKTHRQQYIVNGLELIRDRLAPASGPPMLLVSNRLRKPERAVTAGIVQAFQSYRYQRDKEGNPTAIPYKDDQTDHVLDALRYLYVTTRQDPALHGGRSLSMLGLGDDGRFEKGGLRKLPR